MNKENVTIEQMKAVISETTIVLDNVESEQLIYKVYRLCVEALNVGGTFCSEDIFDDDEEGRISSLSVWGNEECDGEPCFTATVYRDGHWWVDGLIMNPYDIISCGLTRVFYPHEGASEEKLFTLAGKLMDRSFL